MDVDATTKIVPRQHVTLTRTGEEGRPRRYVDRTGTRRERNGGASLGALRLRARDDGAGPCVAAIADEYEVPEFEVETDLLSLLETFRALELIELIPSS